MANIFDFADTWNAGGSVFTGIGLNVTNGSGGSPVYAAGTKLVNLKLDDVERFTVDPADGMELKDWLTIRSGGYYGGGRQFLFMDRTVWETGNGPGFDDFDQNNFHYYETGDVRIEFECDGTNDFYIEAGTGKNASYGYQEGATNLWWHGADCKGGTKDWQLWTGYGVGATDNAAGPEPGQHALSVRYADRFLVVKRGLVLENLASSDPGGGKVWKDASGFLKIG